MRQKLTRRINVCSLYYSVYTVVMVHTLRLFPICVHKCNDFEKNCTNNVETHFVERETGKKIESVAKHIEATSQTLTAFTKSKLINFMQY
jgi:hypothetical protein